MQSPTEQLQDFKSQLSSCRLFAGAKSLQAEGCTCDKDELLPEADAEAPELYVLALDDTELDKSVAATFGRVVIAVTPSLDPPVTAKLTPVGRMPFSPFLSINPKAVTCKKHVKHCQADNAWLICYQKQ